MVLRVLLNSVKPIRLRSRETIKYLSKVKDFDVQLYRQSRYSSRVWQTDGLTDGRNCHMNIVHNADAGKYTSTALLANYCAADITHRSV